jgi:hypothetical protein
MSDGREVSLVGWNIENAIRTRLKKKKKLLREHISFSISVIINNYSIQFISLLLVRYINSQKTNYRCSTRECA